MKKLNKKQSALVALIKKAKFMFREEVNKQTYPESMIDSLIHAGVLVEFKNKITVADAPEDKRHG